MKKYLLPLTFCMFFSLVCIVFGSDARKNSEKIPTNESIVIFSDKSEKNITDIKVRIALLEREVEKLSKNDLSEKTRIQIDLLKQEIRALEDKLISEFKNQRSTDQESIYKEIENRLEIKNENLKFEKERLDSWMEVVGLVIAFFGIVIPIAGFIYGKKVYSDIGEQKKLLEEQKADIKNYFGEIKLECETLLGSIRGSAKEAEDIAKKIGSIADKNPGEQPQLSIEEILKLVEEILADKESTDFQKDLAKGLKHYFRKEYKLAIHCFENLLDRYKGKIADSARADVYLNMGVSYKQLGLIKESLRYYDESLKLNSGKSMTWNNKGHAFMQEEPQVAMIYFEIALALEPENSLAWNNKGILLLKDGRKKEAMECFDLGIIFDPKNSLIWSNKGLVFQRSDAEEDALKCFEKALKNDPKNVLALINKGTVLMKLDKNEEALECFEAVLANDPQNASALVSKGVVLMKLNKKEKALECFESVQENDPNYVLALFNKGLILEAKGQYEAVISIIEEMKKIVDYPELNELISLLNENKTDRLEDLVKRIRSKLETYTFILMTNIVM